MPTTVECPRCGIDVVVHGYVSRARAREIAEIRCEQGDHDPKPTPAEAGAR